MGTPENRVEPPPDKRRQRKARQELSRYLRRLRKACASIESVEEWAEIAGDLNNILQVYRGEIPETYQENLRQAASLTEGTRAGIDQACRVLRMEIEKTLQILPQGGCSCGCLASALIGGFLAVAILAGVLVAAGIQLTRPVEIVIFNDGCEPLAIGEGAASIYSPVLRLLGVELPGRINPGEERAIQVRALPLKVQIDATGNQTVRLSILGRAQTFRISEKITGIEVNGVSTTDSALTFDLRDTDRHTVIVSCH